MSQTPGIANRDEVKERRERNDAIRAAAQGRMDAAASTKLSRQVHMSMFGPQREGSSDLVAKAILGRCGRPADEDTVDDTSFVRLPPTAEFPRGTDLSEDDELRGRSCVFNCEDWLNTLLLGAVPPRVVFDAYLRGSLESALKARAESGDGRRDDDGVLLMVVAAAAATRPIPTTRVSWHISREAFLDAIRVWRCGGGQTHDAPEALRPLCVGVVKKPRDLELDQAVFRAGGRYTRAALMFRPTFALNERCIESLQEAAQKRPHALLLPSDARIAMDLVLMRACCLYAHVTVHAEHTDPRPYYGADAKMRTNTTQFEDDFLLNLFMPDARLYGLETLGHTLFMGAAGFGPQRGAALSVGASSWMCPYRAKFKQAAKLLGKTIRQGRTSAQASPLANVDTTMNLALDFDTCLRVAAWTLQQRRPDDDAMIAAAIPQEARWVQGTTVTLEGAIVRVGGKHSRLRWLMAFHESQPADTDLVYIAFEAHASLGLATLKRALYTLSNTLVRVSADRHPGQWYALIPYTRRAEPLPACLLVARRDCLRAVNLIYEHANCDGGKDGAVSYGLQAAWRDALHAPESSMQHAVARQLSFTTDGVGAIGGDHTPRPHRVLDEQCCRTDVNAIVALVDDFSAVVMTPELAGALARRDSSELHGHSALSDACYDWPTRLRDPCEFQLPGSVAGVDTLARALLRYVFLSEAAVLAFEQR